MRITLSITLVFFCLGICCYAASLRDDPALDKPVTLDVKGEALGDVMRLLTKQSGLHLSVARDISEQKTTILVDDKPIRDVMVGVSALFKYSWRTKTVDEKKRYELCESRERRREKEAKREKERQEAWSRLESQLQLMTDLSAKSKDELLRMSEGIDAEFAPEDASLDGEIEVTAEMLQRFEELAERNSVVLAVTRDPLTLPLVKVYKMLSMQSLEALHAGNEVYYDSESTEAGWLIPSDIANELLDAVVEHRKMDAVFTSKEEGDDGEEVGTNYLRRADGLSIGFLLEDNGEEISVGAKLRYRLNQTEGIGQGGGYVSGETYTLCTASYEEATVEEAETAPVLQVDPALQEKVTLTADELIKEANVLGQSRSTRALAINKSDLLALLHRKSGLQVITDHYSVWFRCSPVKDSAIQDVLTKLLPSYVWNWWLEEKVLFVRVVDAEFFDAAEVPNRLLRRWQAAAAKRGYLDLDDLAEVAQLIDKQIDSFRENSRFLRLGYCDDLDVTWLRFYGLLTAAQRKQLFNGGISPSNLTQAQRDAFSELSEGPLAGPAPDGPLVGIYKDGMRIDKEGGPTLRGVRKEPMLISMERDKDQDEPFVDHIVFDFADNAENELMSIEEASKAAAERVRQNTVYVRKAVYRMVMKYEDECQSCHYIYVPTVTVDKPKEAAVPDQ